MGGGSINDSSTSTEYVSAKALNDILTAMFPIGYVLTTFDTADYSKYMGYNWERLQDTFLYADGTYTVGHIGGNTTHTLTVSEMPKHSHSTRYTGAYANGIYGGQPGTSTDSEPYINTLLIGETGGSQPHNNMPPYTVVRMWRRIS